jgi:hypothetical protein
LKDDFYHTLENYKIKELIQLMSQEIEVSDPSDIESTTPQNSKIERQVKNRLGFVLQRLNPLVGFSETLMPDDNRYLVIEVVGVYDVRA